MFASHSIYHMCVYSAAFHPHTTYMCHIYLLYALKVFFYWLFNVVNPSKVTILSSASVMALSVTELPALHVIGRSWNIDFCGNNPQSWERGKSCLLLAHSVSLSLYTNVSIPGPAATLLTNIIMPTDGCDTTDNHSHFNWHRLSSVLYLASSFISPLKTSRIRFAFWISVSPCNDIWRSRINLAWFGW